MKGRAVFLASIVSFVLVLSLLFPIHTYAGGFKAQPSPADRISREQVKVFSDRIILNISNATWAQFLDTNSMDPVLNSGAMSIEVVPDSPSDIQVGDIISYRQDDYYIVHRVIETGYDDSGWFCRTKGDNSPWPDPQPVRFSDITGVVVGVLY